MESKNNPNMFTQTNEQKKMKKSESVDAMIEAHDFTNTGNKPKINKHKIVRYAQGAGEGAYREVIHATPAKIVTLNTLVKSEKRIDLDVS